MKLLNKHKNAPTKYIKMMSMHSKNSKHITKFTIILRTQNNCKF